MNCRRLINNTIFPVGLPVTWLSPDPAKIPDPYLKNWLLDTGSLTERLQSHCRQFDLQVLGQKQEAVTESEYQVLEADATQRSTERWQVREVVLSGEGVPWVFARSVLPAELCQSDLKGLGRNPLGQKLFNDQRFVRRPFEVCRLSPATEFLALFDIPGCNELWGRRSVFEFQGMRMLVAEMFLPDSPAYAHNPQRFQGDAQC